ncbi:carbohydrate kinase [Lithospermum erythrorhizon]|uniref:Carbohydrate kinase n=1 Tax=Lithospermum erythrorhizon TaxID=34254 RepID=A0AAV3PJN1_LITER
MGDMCWPSEFQLQEMRKQVSELSGRDAKEVRVVVSPFRICPLGAHIDHQGGVVSAMTINKGVLLGFVPSVDSQVFLRSRQFKGDVRFSVDKVQSKAHLEQATEDCQWGNYARGAIYALKTKQRIMKGITGIICGFDGLDSSGLSSSAAVGVAYLLAFECANNLNVSPLENIEYDRLIENEYLGLKNGILDQSAVLLSSYGCLTCMNCKSKEYNLIPSPVLATDQKAEKNDRYRILIAFSGIQQCLTTNPGYNRRVSECQEAASVLLKAAGNKNLDPILCNVPPEYYEAHKGELDPHLAKRAEHYFSENRRVRKGLEAWRAGNIPAFGKLMSESGLSSIQNYECGSPPLIHLYEIMVKAPGVYGTRFSGAGFRGCCLAFVDVDKASEAAAFVKKEYCKLQPELTGKMQEDKMVLICDAGGCACVV